MNIIPVSIMRHGYKINFIAAQITCSEHIWINDHFDSYLNNFMRFLIVFLTLNLNITLNCLY